MGDLAIPASLHWAGGNRPPVAQTAAEAVGLLAPVYRSTAGLRPGESGADADRANLAGMAILAAAAGEAVIYVVDGKLIFPSPVLAVRTEYALSRNRGRVCPIADVTDNDILYPIGIAESTTVLDVVVRSTGIRFKPGGTVLLLTDDAVNATVVTDAPHGRATGNSVFLAGTGTGYDLGTNGPYTITVVDANTFTLGFTLNAVGDVTVGRWGLT